MGKGNFAKRFKDIVSGDFIIRKRLDKYIGFVFAIFWLFAGFIAWNLHVESKLVKVVDGENTIKELKIYRDQTSIELLRLDHRNIVEDLLKKNDSALTAPVEPAKIIEGGSL